LTKISIFDQNSIFETAFTYPYLSGTGSSVLDTRVIRIEAILTGECTTTDLTLECPARGELVQNIPLVNNTPHNWTMLSAFISGSTFGIFYGPERFDVPPGECFLFPLAFLPKHVDTYKTQMIIENIYDGTILTRVVKVAHQILHFLIFGYRFVFLILTFLAVDLFTSMRRCQCLIDRI